MTESLGLIDSPAEQFKRIHELQEDGSVAFSFTHRQHYLPRKSDITLHGVIAKEDGHTWCIIRDDPTVLALAVGRIAGLEGAIDMSMPLLLTPVRIDKPWGAEIWYTGIEARGVSMTNDTPLPWVLDIAGSASSEWDSVGCGGGPPILLKILDPFAEETLGDLYFELHEEKVEVYVVTSIDPSAWPGGTGYIRYGFSPVKLAAYETRAAFAQDYLLHVDAYRSVRDEIDTLFDQFRDEDGIGASDVVAPATVAAWRSRLAPKLIETERRCRKAMDAFTTLEPLAVGDVVRVTPYTPHSLQHGVRVVEFQTPHYERHILSFGQKVLTQDHWDTEQALAKVDWNARLDKHVDPVTSTDAFTADRVADFGEFRVLRLTIRENGTFVQDLRTYALIIGVTGSADVNGATCGKEDALLVPRMAGRLEIESRSGCCLLLAVPR